MRFPTAAITAGSLIGGWQLARRRGVRALGGVVLAAGGAVAGREWSRRTSPAMTGALVATYLGAFGLSHPLAKRIGGWPSVLAVSALTAGVSYALADRKPQD
jgi:drug/metabolite transporter (DMT)-like permease